MCKCFLGRHRAYWLSSSFWGAFDTEIYITLAHARQADLLVCQCFIIGRGEFPIDNKQCSMQHNSQTQCKIQATPTKSFSICSKQKNIFFPQSLQLYLHTLFLHRPSTYYSIFLASTSLHPVSLSACGWIVSFPCNTNYCALLRSREQRGEIKDLWSTAL